MKYFLHNVVHIGMAVVSITFLFCWVAFLYLFCIQGNPPAQYNNIPFPVDQETYQAGEVVAVYVDVCKPKHRAVLSEAMIVDGFMVPLAPITTSGMEEGCTTEWLIGYKLPSFLPVGEYYMKGVNTYEINFLRSRSIEWETAKFTIVE